jgi:predicted HTH transcriptional regulator
MIFTETEKVELKQKFNDALPKEIVAFLNTDGGTIYIGVNDDGSICGVIRLDETLKKIADILENQVLPDPRACVEVGTKYIDEKHVVEIKVKKGDGLFYVKKYGRSSQGCFVRIGSTSRPMTEDQIMVVHNKYLDSKVKITDEFLDFFLRVTIPFAFELEVEEGVPQGVPQSVPQGFSEMQKKIFQCIKENPKVSRQKIAEKLGVSMKTIARNLLQMKNCVQFVGRGYSGHWEIVG